MIIIDCTLRDGGYYTHWDFDIRTIDSYIEAMNKLPIDYLELGYRNKATEEYLGKFGYCPVSVLKDIKKKTNKKLAVMINEKSVKPDDLDSLIAPIIGVVEMIRIAIDYKNIDRAIVLAQKIKSYGFEVGFNVMYMSTWLTNQTFLKKLHQIDGIIDVFYMVDSFGGITPEEIKEIVKVVKSNTNSLIGFHGHNNLQLGLINTLTAIECGVDYIDATILGMGRGAGNLNMELLLTYLNKKGLEVDFNVLGDVITAFGSLYEKYRWGTQLPYMISGANSIPQKEVMELVTNRVYSFNSVVRGLQNRKNNIEDNAKYPIFKFPKYDEVLIVGGGSSPIEHYEAICSFVKSRKSIALIFATARHANMYRELDIPQIYCLVGKEAKRLSENVDSKNFKGFCVLPPYPRKLGTDVPDFAKEFTFELSSIDFTGCSEDSCTTIALQIALNISTRNVYVIGYDGYPGNVLSEKEVALSNENMTLFKDFENSKGSKLISLTPTIYPELKVESVYQFI